MAAAWRASASSTRCNVRGEQDHVFDGRLEDRPSSQVISILGIERG